ncbi:MAG: hypothetical protein FIA94_09420 [Nitrospirae bacterium]|nr:hypothetical protein [Nitrospirota bacterium]
MKKLIGFFVVLTVVLAGAAAVFAFGSYLTDPGTGFNAVYPAATAISHCVLCHVDPAGGGARNPYGTDFASSAIPGHTAHAFDAALEALDSDGDTFSNITEINASKYPGDATSHPPVPAETITITDPNGGEIVLSGATHAILYTASAGVASVKAKYSIDGGLTWLPAIDAGGSTSGSFNWAVPTPKKNLTKVRAMLLGYNASNVKVAKDKSDALFTIETLTITAPAAGATVTGGGSQVITWTTNGTKAPADSFILYYSTNNGLTWKRIFQSAAGSGNPGTYTWDNTSERPIPTPASPKTKSLIKLILKSGTGATVATDISDKFTIQ